jgi:hypothetical protein
VRPGGETGLRVAKGDVPSGAAHGPGVIGLPRHACTAARRRPRVAALWSTGARRGTTSRSGVVSIPFDTV